MGSMIYYKCNRYESYHNTPKRIVLLLPATYQCVFPLPFLIKSIKPPLSKNKQLIFMDSIICRAF